MVLVDDQRHRCGPVYGSGRHLATTLLPRAKAYAADFATDWLVVIEFTEMAHVFAFDHEDHLLGQVGAVVGDSLEPFGHLSARVINLRSDAMGRSETLAGSINSVAVWGR